MTRNPWSKTEDATLKCLVARYGDNRGPQGRWGDICKSLPGRTRKDCRKRWFHSLDPSVRKGRWTQEEDKILLQNYDRLGPAWKQIALAITGRKDDQCSKRYCEILGPLAKDRLRDWSVEEDKRLTELVGTLGSSWSVISTHMDRRTALTCRNRWRRLSSKSQRTPTATMRTMSSVYKNARATPQQTLTTSTDAGEDSSDVAWSENAASGMMGIASSMSPESSDPHTADSHYPRDFSENRQDRDSNPRPSPKQQDYPLTKLNYLNPSASSVSWPDTEPFANTDEYLARYEGIGYSNCFSDSDSMLQQVDSSPLQGDHTLTGPLSNPIANVCQSAWSTPWPFDTTSLYLESSCGGNDNWMPNMHGGGGPAFFDGSGNIPWAELTDSMRPGWLPRQITIKHHVVHHHYHHYSMPSSHPAE